MIPVIAAYTITSPSRYSNHHRRWIWRQKALLERVGLQQVPSLENLRGLVVDQSDRQHLLFRLLRETVSRMDGFGKDRNCVQSLPGDEHSGYQGDGGPANSAELNFPDGLALDAAGNLYIADAKNNLIRKADAKTGLISTVAGFPGSFCCSIDIGDGGPATSAFLSYPNSVAFDTAGRSLHLGLCASESTKSVCQQRHYNDVYAGSGSGTESSGDEGDQPRVQNSL